MSQESSMETTHDTARFTLERIPTGAIQANCYLLTCTRTRQTLVVDPGAEAPRILARLHDLGTSVVSILHTHGHFDHIAATEAVLAGLPATVPVAAHPSDAFLYSREARAVGEELGYTVPDALATPDVALDDGAEVVVGALRLRVIHTPGHTPGGVCLLGDDTFLLTGDTLFRRGIGRTDLPGGDEDALYESILTRLYPLPEHLTVYPGHGASTTIAEERRANPFVQADDVS
jgi:glyoxylase-like metal-dependent hydrolase (beta-lactamase superfamily II)